MFRTSHSYFWNVPQYTQEKLAVVRLAEPLARKCKVITICKQRMMLMSSLVVLEVLVVGDEEDYVAFCEEICLEWDHIYNPVCT